MSTTTFRAASVSLTVALAGVACIATAATAPTAFLVVSQDTWHDAHGAPATPRIDAQGHPVVLVEANADVVAALGRHVHERERRCGGFFSFPTRAEAEAFLAHAPDAPLWRGGYPIDNQATVSPWLSQVSELAIRTSISTLEAFHNRYYASPTGAEAAGWIRDQWLMLAAGRDDVHAELFTDCNDCGGQPSVILTIEGATLPDENVVLGAHLDSVNWSAADPMTARAPGADDDASGVATLTEILRIAMASGYRPDRTVRFMAYAAEEVGLNGSQAIVASYQDEGIQVVGALQLDMTNYNEPGQVDMEIIADFTDAGLNTFVASLFDEYLAPLGLTRGSSNCGYGCSDHAPWQAAGYPSSFVFEGGGLAHSFEPVHTANDLLANMGGTAERSIPFAQLGLAFLGELAKGGSGPLDVIFANGFEPVPNQAPTAAFEYDAQGLDVSFTSTSSDADGSITAHAWDFDDGNASADANPQHVYAAGGIYQVSLTVTDDDGDSDTRVRTVVASPAGGPLQNGVPVTGLADLSGGMRVFTVDVPDGASNLVVATSGGSGDLDLYLRLASEPTTGVYDCASTSPSTTEQCAIAAPAAGTWYILAYAYSNYSGVTLSASYQP